ncbi:hypothetical protein CJP74_04600 [Psittacicella melopsittaci]|uniref:Uncharacterized protein n=1 Tax=Psittacicella melopsittaci TaxID=2028576 RepID=A0A3A1Y4C1_9GAMM|nr:farnesyl diphosphate synthase [Psittacicella melopsittaci]RIY32415.1 hypothetical protein CJP74_04600 [Psittacicella melopsittaci]
MIQDKKLEEQALSLNDLAELVVEKHQLATELSKDLPLEQVLSLVSQATKDFIKLVLGTGADPLRQLFSQDQTILSLLPSDKDSDKIMQKFDIDKLSEAMFYSLYSDGKMLRPALVFIGGILTKANLSDLLIAAMAIEAIHTYSLIHDDLPAMDNDDYRRGKLTNHKVFGESMAILAGDALQTLAFSLLSSNQKISPKAALEQIRILSYGAGHYGMCLGQALDILGDDLTINKLKELNLSTKHAELRLSQIHYRKTAFLIRSSVLLGLYAKERSKTTLLLEDILSKWAYNLGLTFQIKDDILDVKGNEQEIGKPVGSDQTNHKLTYVSLFGLEEAEKKLESNFVQTLGYVEQLDNLISGFSEMEFSRNAVNWLREITVYVVNRRK